MSLLVLRIQVSLCKGLCLIYVCILNVSNMTHVFAEKNVDLMEKSQKMTNFWSFHFKIREARNYMASRKNIFKLLIYFEPIPSLYFSSWKAMDQVLNIEQSVYFQNRYLSESKNWLLNVRKSRLYKLWWEYVFYSKFDHLEDKP